jgi:hypothetical protein
MVANWTCVLAELRSKALTHDVVIPEHPIADGRWHGCEVAGGNRGAGAYLLFQHLPHVAIYTNRADSRGPEVWRPDGDRLLPFGHEPRIADALTLLVADVVAGPAKSLRQPAAVEGIRTPASARHSPRQAAVRLLETLLAKGALRTLEIRAQAKDAGISWASVRRAAASLGIVVKRKGFGSNGGWTWQLPKVLNTQDAQDRQLQPR